MMPLEPGFLGLGDKLDGIGFAALASMVGYCKEGEIKFKSVSLGYAGLMGTYAGFFYGKSLFEYESFAWYVMRAGQMIVGGGFALVIGWGLLFVAMWFWNKVLGL
jgi:hypothetical protein